MKNLPERVRRLALALVALGSWWIAGCGNDPSKPAPNQPPDTFLPAGNPPDSSRVPNHVTFNFNGQDIDGTVPRTFDYILVTYPRSVATVDQVHPQVPAENDPRWTRVNSYHLDLALLADTLRADPRGDIGFGEFDRWHSFYVRAVDNEGAIDPTPDSRTFQAFTQAPVLHLLAPAQADVAVTLPRTFAMHWDGYDPIGRGDPLQDPREARWVLVPATLDGGGHPIGFPAALYDLPESQWSPWMTWANADSSGRRAILRNQVTAGVGSFVFAVQGRDDGGAVTPKFDGTTLHLNNYAAVTLDASLPAGPRVIVHSRQDTLSAWTIEGTPPQINVSVPNDTLTLYWDSPRASHYGGRGTDTRYGWNITNVDDDLQWTAFSTARIAPPQVIHTGGDIFYIQARDDLGQVTSGKIAFQKVVQTARRRP